MASQDSFNHRELVHVGRLNGSNFSTWKIQTCFILTQHGLVDITVGKSMKPDLILDEDNVATNATAIER